MKGSGAGDQGSGSRAEGKENQKWVGITGIKEFREQRVGVEE